jgi:hypothetical protein
MDNCSNSFTFITPPNLQSYLESMYLVALPMEPHNDIIKLKLIIIQVACKLN